MTILPQHRVQLFSQRVAGLLRQLTRGLAAESAPVREAATDLEELDLIAWGQRFLPKHFAKPPSPMHRWLSDQFEAMRARRGVKVNLIGPRGGAKSTVATLAAAIRAAVEDAEPYVWIVSDTHSQAKIHLDNLKSELTDNQELRDAYPAATGAPHWWRSTSIKLSNGAVIESYGAGQRLRGRRRGAERPTLIICDDLENDQHIVSAHQRDVSRQWFFGTLLKAGAKRTNVMNLATALHRDALAMRLRRSPGWRSELFPSVIDWPTETELWDAWEAIYCRADGSAAADARQFYQRNHTAMNRGARVLWPEEEDLYMLMRMRVEGGVAAFEREKQGVPVDPERCEWPDEYFGDAAWFDEWPAELRLRTMALDPSKGGDARHGDYSAYVMLGVGPDGVLHVEADLARRPTPQMVSDGVEWMQRFKPDAFGVEANQWQQLLAGEFTAECNRRGMLGITPCEITNHTNKAMRIRRLGPYLSQRRIRFRRASESTRLLVDQLRDFPLASHDDGPDALEMALRLAEEVWRGRKEVE